MTEMTATNPIDGMHAAVEVMRRDELEAVETKCREEIQALEAIVEAKRRDAQQAVEAKYSALRTLLDQTKMVTVDDLLKPQASGVIYDDFNAPAPIHILAPPQGLSVPVKYGQCTPLTNAEYSTCQFRSLLEQKSGPRYRIAVEYIHPTPSGLTWELMRDLRVWKVELQTPFWPHSKFKYLIQQNDLRAHLEAKRSVDRFFVTQWTNDTHAVYPRGVESQKNNFFYAVRVQGFAAAGTAAASSTPTAPAAASSTPTASSAASSNPTASASSSSSTATQSSSPSTATPKKRRTT